MRFIKRLLPVAPVNPDAASSGSEQAESAAPAERRRVPFKCRACGRVRPPYVYAENAHHYCVDCARRSWKLMRLKPVARRHEDRDLEARVLDEAAS